MKKTILFLFATILISSCSSSGGDDPMEQDILTISVSEASINFSDTKINENSEKTFNINNTGNKTISFSDISVPTGFSVSPISG